MWTQKLALRSPQRPGDTGSWLRLSTSPPGPGFANRRASPIWSRGAGERGRAACGRADPRHRSRLSQFRLARGVAGSGVPRAPGRRRARRGRGRAAGASGTPLPARSAAPAVSLARCYRSVSPLSIYIHGPLPAPLRAGSVSAGVPRGFPLLSPASVLLSAPLRVSRRPSPPSPRSLDSP